MSRDAQGVPLGAELHSLEAGFSEALSNARVLHQGMEGTEMATCDVEELSKRLAYDPLTGEFTRRIVRNSRALARADRPAHSGYRMVSVDQMKFLAHRVAWLLTHGEWPHDEIDHINGIRDDNRLVNLRQATRVQNCHNVVHPTGSTGLFGVSKQPHTRRYRGRVWIDNKSVHLGYFDTPEEASAAAFEHANASRGAFAASVSRGTT